MSLGTTDRPPVATTLPTPSPAPSAPAAAPKPVSTPATPKAAPSSPPAKLDIGLPKQPVRPTVDPKRALGLPESPRSTIAELVKGSRAKLKLDAEPFSPTPAVKPAVAPVVPTPAAAPVPEPVIPPAEVVPAPAAATPPPAEEPPHPLDAKIKELQDQVEEMKRQKAPPPAPAPEPAAETPEQLRDRQTAWVSEYAPHLVADLTEAQMDNILAGGPEAVSTLNKVRQTDMARAVLEARTSIYHEINPVISEISRGVGVLLQEHINIQRFNIETQFFGKYPDMSTQRDYCNQVADYLLQTYPEQCSKLQPDQFIDYLHGETSKLLDAQAKRVGFASWKDAVSRSAAAPAPAAVPPAPAVAAAPAAVPPAAVPGVPRHISAPGPNLPPAVLLQRTPAAPAPPAALAPGAAPVGGAPKNWASAVAMDLRG
jgi:hypothetical protein